MKAQINLLVYLKEHIEIFLKMLFKLHFFIALRYTLSLQRGFLPSNLPANILCTFIPFPLSALYLARFIALDLLDIIICWKQHKL
jgi:hypothetical protein